MHPRAPATTAKVRRPAAAHHLATTVIPCHLITLRTTGRTTGRTMAASSTGRTTTHTPSGRLMHTPRIRSATTGATSLTRGTACTATVWLHTTAIDAAGR